MKPFFVGKCSVRSTSKLIPKLILCAALALSGVLATGLSASAAVCMNHKNLVTFLSDRYSEAPRALGLVEDRGLMEVYVSDKGTWTIVMTTAQGIACILAAGDTWEETELQLSAGPEY
ncbi:MAG: hypothetical protein K8F25_14990 [Fimbriimonadaceae bacterium]|nr:hypothetical protein [Alphaproteobacteria bacterium]